MPPLSLSSRTSIDFSVAQSGQVSFWPDADYACNRLSGPLIEHADRSHETLPDEAAFQDLVAKLLLATHRQDAAHVVSFVGTMRLIRCKKPSGGFPSLKSLPHLHQRCFEVPAEPFRIEQRISIPVCESARLEIIRHSRCQGYLDG